MKVLVVGIGRWGEKHLRVLAELGVEVWASDLSAERRQLAARAGVPPERLVPTFRDALPAVDAVDVVTPADSHLAIATESLRAGKACFVEKPVTLTVAEARRLARVAAHAGRPLQVGHIFRFHPVTDVLRERLDAGTLGRLRYCTASFSGFKRPRADVGVTQTDAIHYFDLFAHVLGRPATAVTATLHDHLGRGLDDQSVCAVEYGDVTAFVEAGYFAPGTRRDCVIVGDQGTLAADFASSEIRVTRNLHVRDGDAGWQAREGEVETVKASGAEPLRRELEAFLDAAMGRAPVPVDMIAGTEALRVVEAAQRSSRTGRRVPIGPARPVSRGPRSPAR
jgi:UDP-N-acetylglucosamine 3-dehydrogenase